MAINPWNTLNTQLDHVLEKLPKESNKIDFNGLRQSISDCDLAFKNALQGKSFCESRTVEKRQKIEKIVT
jgi:hypothetical protein